MSFLMWIAVRPENMCQWNCTGLSVKSYLAINVDASHMSETLSPMSDSDGHCCFSHTVQSKRTHGLLFSTNCPIGCSSRGNYSRILCPSFATRKFHRIQSIVFEVFKSGSHSFNNCLCFWNLMIHHNPLKQNSSFFTQVKGGPTYNR